MMSSDLHDVFGDGQRRRTARWLVVAGFGVWVAGLALWELTWIGSLAASFAGGAALTYGLSRMARGSGGTASPVWAVTVPVAISLVLISQGVGQAEFAVRVVLVGLGTLGMVVVFVRVLDERLTVERQLADSPAMCTTWSATHCRRRCCTRPQPGCRCGPTPTRRSRLWSAPSSRDAGR
jgi:hypothetical protein